ncbi:MAG: putative lipid II flippase FtsW [Bdellovibrionales bacterium]|jgi:cell division protein FtsW|nr:putative lipid II flippase FtsW [Bdellovibrionales bacterium]MBT3526048.1 putative lipid II flippase FtsW [Bdellovibrionales bacterium]MBT7668786.1 putative lipid II flippase FtsW [Bdellovibrionales bacterium]MBT7767057.1 putative lipid II flippase FtsW [Bdellovibrionales bacterium]
MEVSSSEIDRGVRYFLINLAVIILMGVMMVYSSSYLYAKDLYGSSSYFFVRQLSFAFGGSILAWIVGQTRFNFWYKYAYHLNIAVTLLLVLTLLPGIGLGAKGAFRWITFGGITIQPAEPIKYTLLLAALCYFEQFNALNVMQRIRHGLILVAPLLVLTLQPDFGTFSICFLLISFTCLMSSFPKRYFYSSFAVGVVIAITVLVMKPYRVQRILTFLDPWKNSKTSGFQIIQSYLAFANGSFLGKGIGNSHEKLFYLPEAHNDFIFSVVGEELGFIGVLFVVLLFASLIFFGLKLAIKLEKRKRYLTVVSIIFLLGLQAVLNMGVVLGLLPTKGMNLPFISYGGSSLISNFFAIGLILSAIKANRKDEECLQEVKM